MSGTSFLIPADSIVIDRATLPPVCVSDIPGAHEIRGRTYNGTNAVEARDFALNLLALAEYLDAHPPKPPVDEAQVEALVKAIIERVPGSHPVAMVPADQTRDVIRALLATGKVTVTRDV